MNQLAWSDIFTDASLLDARGLLALWPNTVSGNLAPIGFSAFGDCFFHRPTGEIHRLDVLEGGLHLVAQTFPEFQGLMNSEKWQEDFLLTHGVALLTERGLTRSPGQFYAFAPHPAMVGKIDWNRVMAMDAIVWHSICAQVLDSAP